jgi:hypothetical protein
VAGATLPKQKLCATDYLRPQLRNVIYLNSEVCGKLSVKRDPKKIDQESKPCAGSGQARHTTSQQEKEPKLARNI